MPTIEMPPELGKAHWDRKKGAVPPGSPLESQLKTFDKKYQAVDWSPFADGWESKASTADELDKAYAAVDRAWRAKVFALKAEGQAVADAAQKLLKEKGLAKATLDAVKAITDAAKAFGKAIDDGLASLEKARDRAAKALPSDEEVEDETPNALLDPKKLLAQLQALKRDPAKRAHFACLVDAKQPTMLAMATRVAGKKMFATLQAATGVKTGSFGRAWIAEDVLYLEVEKPYGGLLKKLRPALKAVGFKVGKLVLAGEDGTPFEQDEDAGDAPAAAPAAAAAAAAPGAGVVFTQTRLVWDQTRKKVQAELRRLEASILDVCKDEPDFAEIAAGTKNLYTVLEYLDERLMDKLDEALNAATPADRQARHDEAREIVEEYVDFVESEDLMRDIDDNGFVGVAIASTLTTSLNAIGQRLRA